MGKVRGRCGAGKVLRGRCQEPIQVCVDAWVSQEELNEHVERIERDVREQTQVPSYVPLLRATSAARCR
jgi:hypothetical protein